ncbi:MAG TPA: hypothetical protein PKY59_21160 [Pyrinomonadaceae bacterium]|nr:hypothetical protein [Pyrinomonadaceae bacterium]
MKQFTYICGLALLVFTLNFTMLAQDNSNQAEIDDLNKISKLSKSKKDEDHEKAYELAKEFLKKYDKGKENENVKKIKGFVENYRMASFNKKLDDGKTAEAFAMGKQMLAETPDDPYITMSLAYGGFDAFVNRKDKTFAADSLAYARQTLKSFEAGKFPKSYAPLKDQTEATALMYYAIGTLEVDSNLDDAAVNFYKSVQYDSQFKAKAYAYEVITYFYEQKYNALAQDFQKKHGSKTAEDAAMKADEAKLDKVLNNMLDAYARGIKVAEAAKDPVADQWKKRFAEVYQFVKKSDAGAADFLTNQPNQPFPNPSEI